ncbi:PREDICTED: uncharacterized protein LOC108570420 [Habropoda laboriosa]|uniref:uncharacterized protein LOC108570420 n=1 Tax=Habropoda laboriosa TaxID=597456 RepID=UPI00083CDCC4|nr:PREDICTED: uncharacterized protein LOC108570420 [Habropoda laboriosa]
MQKDHSDTPKSRRTTRVRNASTPELVKRNLADSTLNIHASSSHHRQTMAASDFTLPQSFTKNRNTKNHIPMLSTQTSLDGILDSDSDDIELKLLYDEYLQNIMTEIILKKKAEEKEKLCISQLATIAKESKIQNEIDSQIIDVNNCTKGEDFKTLENILSQLHSLLRPLDVLHCNNIILPDTPEEWKETSKLLKSCSETLKSIMDSIGTKKESYKTVNNGINEFVSTANDIEDHQKRLEKELRNLQILVLKTASLSLMQSHN